MSFHRSAGYERLTTSDAADKKAARPKRCCWLRRMKGRFRGFRVTSTRRLNWKAISIVIMPKRISGMYGDIVKRMVTDGAYPANILLSCQWGFPMLSYGNHQMYRH